MDKEKATLKDIASVLGVSTTTVHRALNGKPGISDQMRAAVQALAAEMGYETNLAASVLKRRKSRIAVLLPEPMLENRYYYAALWSGIRQFMEEHGNFYAQLTEFYYPLLPGGHGNMLKKIYESHLEEIDGLITLGIAANQSSYFIDKLNRAQIPCVILGSDLYCGSRLCCVKAYDEMAGSLAAELFTAFLPDDSERSIILTGNPVGETAMVDQYHNLEGFQNYLQNENKGIRLHAAYCADTDRLDELVEPFFAGQGTLPFGIYASSARHTVKMCRILEKRHLAGMVRLIGNDSFPESLEYIRRNILTASIDKKIYQQAYHAANILLDYLTYGHYPERDVIQIHPEILMKSNLPS